MPYEILGTMQEIFDKVCLHLDQQGHAAIVNGSCKYRGRNGDRCAIGCLIPDSEYKKSFESRTFYKLQMNGNLRSPVSSFLASLQAAHDRGTIEGDLRGLKWPQIKDRLLLIASDYKLDNSLLQSLPFIPH